MMVLRVSVSSVPEAELQTTGLEPSSLSLMETLCAPQGVLNGFSSTGGGPDPDKTSSPPVHTCPLGVHKAVLLYPLKAKDWFKTHIAKYYLYHKLLLVLVNLNQECGICWFCPVCLSTQICSYLVNWLPAVWGSTRTA